MRLQCVRDTEYNCITVLNTEVNNVRPGHVRTLTKGKSTQPKKQILETRMSGTMLPLSSMKYQCVSKHYHFVHFNHSDV